MYRIFTSLLSIGLLLLCHGLGSKPGRGKYTEHHTEIAGQKRRYVRYNPASTSHEKLIIALHGGGGRPEAMIRLAPDLPKLADKHGIVLIYPQGLGGHWNDGRKIISQSAALGTDDIGFLAAIIDIEKSRAPIRRVAVVGISNGGMMAQRVACEIPQRVTMVASIAANLSVELSEVCKPSQATAVLFIPGIADPIVPYHGGTVKVLGKGRGEVLSIEDSLAFWSARYGCKVHAETNPTANTLERTYHCARGKLKLLAVKDGGHAWPGGTPYLPERLIGKTTQEFSASEKIIEFLD